MGKHYLNALLGGVKGTCSTLLDQPTRVLFGVVLLVRGYYTIWYKDEETAKAIVGTIENSSLLLAGTLF